MWRNNDLGKLGMRTLYPPRARMRDAVGRSRVALQRYDVGAECSEYEVYSSIVYIEYVEYVFSIVLESI